MNAQTLELAGGEQIFCSSQLEGNSWTIEKNEYSRDEVAWLKPDDSDNKTYTQSVL